MTKSLLFWIGGAVAGATLFKKTPVKAGMLGGLIVGGIGDVWIERNDPKYTGN